MPLPLASYKIRIADGHVRAVPALALDGTPFVDAGVDLRGADAVAIIDAARPMVAWLDAREPGVVVRSISVRTKEPRVLVSLAPIQPTADARPRALRFDPPHANELVDAGRDAERLIADGCSRALARRLTSRA